MKNSVLTFLLFILLTNSSFSQRYVPLIAENRTLAESYQGPNNAVHDMVEYNDKLVIVGEFTEINQEPMNSIAYWDGLNYSAFSTPLENSIYIRDVLNTPLGLVISGEFDSGNILLYNGSAWQQLGDGLDDAVLDIIWHENKLWACGKFEESGSNSTQKVAYFENDSWVQAGDGFNNDVKEMIIFENELYAAGDFTSSGTEGTSHIAKWTSTNWEEIGSGMNGNVNCLEVHEGKLILGGEFTNTGNTQTPVYKLASFDGETFSSVIALSEEITSIGYLESHESLLFITEGNNTTGINEDTEGPGYLKQNEELLDLQIALGLTKVQFFEGKLICSALEVGISSNDKEFFTKTGLGIFKLNGQLEEDFINGNITTTVSCRATQFINPENNWANYHTEPNLPNASTIYAAAPWIGGIANDELTITYETFSQNESPDIPFYRMGPISDVYDQAYAERYFRVWKTSSAEIQNHIANYSQPGYIIPESILKWPGNGRVDYGESAHLAPFVDINENGWYDPNDGDYPAIEGDIAIFYILSGTRGEILTDVNPLKADICVMMYGFSSEDEDLKNTSFLRYRIINKSAVDFDEFKFGFWVDGDIGNFGDDYVGCSPSRNTMYNYNGDNDDEGLIGYGVNPPAQGVRFLNDSLNKHVYYKNTTSQNGDPQVPAEYWNYLNGIWRNGLPLTYGGNGFQYETDPDSIVCHMFPTDPWISSSEDPLAWNEPSSGFFPSDRRNIGSTPAINFSQGEIKCYDLALVTSYAEEPLSGNIYAVKGMLERSDAVQTYYDNNVSACGPETFPLSINEEVIKQEEITLFPNPTSGRVFIKGIERSAYSEIKMTDISGKLVKSSLTNSNEVDVSNLQSGTYILTVINKNQIVSRNKLIID